MAIKVFLSWSGEISHKVAVAFREWLPSVIQSVQPYVSSEDIDKGTRWSTDIAKELEASAYGILCVTKDNLEAPWLCFEAGALSKSIDKSNVTPFLFNIKRSDIQGGPLLQFQSAINEKEDVFKLVGSINKRIDEAERIKDTQLRKTFDVWWPHLEESLTALKDLVPKEEGKSSKTDDAQSRVPIILEELLDLARRQQLVLSDPDSLFPRQFIDRVTKDMNDMVVRRDLKMRRELAGSIYQSTIKILNAGTDLMHGDTIDRNLLEEIMVEAAAINGLVERLRGADYSPRRGHAVVVRDGKVVVKDGKVVVRSIPAHEDDPRG